MVRGIGLTLVLIALSTNIVLAESRPILIKVRYETPKDPRSEQQPEPLVTIYSDVKDDRLTDGTLDDAIKKLAAVKGWGSQVPVTIVVEPKIRSASLIVLLKALDDNAVLSTAAVSTETPAQLAAHFKLPPALKLELFVPDKPLRTGDEVPCRAVLSATDDRSYAFDVGSFPQIFGLYLLGPARPHRTRSERGPTAKLDARRTQHRKHDHRDERSTV
ncbi:MAG: hypothetical protein QM811_29950 [Pirellulales bacterium]